MTATPSRLPTAPEGVLRAVERRYDVGLLELREPLEGRIANDAVIVNSSAGGVLALIDWAYQARDLRSAQELE